MLEIYHRTPFSQPIIPVEFEFTGRGLMGLKNNPNKIVRNMAPLSPDMSFDKQIAALKTRISAWRQFGTFSGLQVPDFSVLVGNGILNSFNSRAVKHNFYILVDRVDGQIIGALGRAVTNSPRFQSRLDEMFSGLVCYTTFIYQNGGFYLTDQKLDQYVYGSTVKNPKKAFYFVDLDWEGTFYDAQDHNYIGNDYFYGSFLRNISALLRDVERRFKLELPKSRSRFLEFLYQVQESNPSPYHARRIAEVIGKLAR